MSDSSIRNKTIRPGSLNGYSYYYSNRQNAIPAKPAKAKGSHRKSLLIIAVLVLAFGLWLGFHGSSKSDQQASNTAAPASQSQKTPVTSNPAVTSANEKNNCQGNTLSKLIKVSVSQRHLWACENSKTVYDTPVITGLQNHPETETPIGTYKVYGKTTDTTLKGSDSRGSWSDPVYYWMPFLDNQYGTYGFHDATWRAADAFGNVSPDSEDASHGCVELPLASSKWLYNWTPVHTVVKVES